MKEQAPIDPARLQARQRPLHATLQQTPSTQLPLEHWLPPAHAVPLVFFAAHVLFTSQNAIATQSMSDPHAPPTAQPAHVPPPQSTPVSALFLTLSLQFGTQVPPAPLHWLPAQSAFTSQPLLGPHAAH